MKKKVSSGSHNKKSLPIVNKDYIPPNNFGEFLGEFGNFLPTVVKDLAPEINKPFVSPEEEVVIQNMVKQNPTLFPGITDYQMTGSGLESSGLQEPWIQTYSGRRFNPLNPVEDAIVIQDIAHSLSMICRFGGHTRFHYSVALHSIGVSYLCDKEYQLQGLLHDASEGYSLGDVASPIKKTPEFETYRKIEHKLQTLIYKKFGVSEIEHHSVKDADLKMLATEANDLLSPLHPEWKLPTNPLPFGILKISPEEAEQLFLNRFYELNNSNEKNKCFMPI